MLGRINWHPTKRDLRYFAITLAVVVVLFALLFLLRGKTTTAVWITGIGVAVSAFCYLIPPLGKLLYLLWMAITFILGRIISPIVTALILYLLVTPIGLITRLTGKDRLRLKKPKNVSTYFVNHADPIDKESFRRQF